MQSKLLTLGSLLLLAGCGGGKLAVTEIVVGSELDEGRQVIEQVGSFVPSDYTIYARVTLRGVTKDTEIRGSWWHEEASHEGNDEDHEPSRKFFETSVTVTEELPVASFLVQNKNPWPSGTYRFVISHEGGVLLQKEIVVASGE